MQIEESLYSAQPGGTVRVGMGLACPVSTISQACLRLEALVVEVIWRSYRDWRRHTLIRANLGSLESEDGG